MTTPAPVPDSNPLAIEMIQATVTAIRSPEKVVLEGVDWSVAVGDYWVIGGLHASGKSDFMAVAAGIMPPARGVCRVFGRDLFAGPDHESLPTRLRIGMVFDGGQLLHHLTVAENVALPIGYHRNQSQTEINAQVDALLALTGLASAANERPGFIGRNRQQRAGLARALALRPEVLLLDNPLTGLDPRDVWWWLDLLDQLSAGHPILNGRPLTLAVTGDDLRPWRRRARQFAVLKEKSLIVLGNRPDLDGHPEPLLQELLPAAAPGA